jgi:predicted small metal-binding protein
MKCEDAGVDCKGKFEAETKEQVLEEISSHLEETHPDLAVTMDHLETLIHLNR